MNSKTGVEVLRSSSGAEWVVQELIVGGEPGLRGEPPSDRSIEEDVRWWTNADGLERRDSIARIKGKSCDIGYALAAGSCEGVNRVDACTVTASDVTAAFATSGPNLLLAKPVGFFGSECLANCFALAITQPTSDWRRLIEAKPFGRRYKPDIGYAPAACSCERAGNVDACTV